MSMFLTRPHPLRPWWQQGLRWLWNLVGWIVPAAQDVFDQDCGPDHQRGVQVLFVAHLAMQVALWATWAMSNAGTAWLAVTAVGSVALYLLLGGMYVVKLLEMGGSYHDEPKPRPW
ncbi:MAG: hypothetical protein JWL87_368 [Candidatus Adlerbacteria bacterium]|nr:hypothetical protein [Candidatus Adlerbacteria bacterium]